MHFAKMQGVGNSFVVVSEEEVANVASLPELSLSLCRQHSSVGADGLLVIGKGAGDYAFSFRMFNPDGTEDMCGNGLRCACLWAAQNSRIDPADPAPFVVATREGPRSCRIVEMDAGRKKAQVEVDMGSPKLAPADIPCLAPLSLAQVIDYPLEVAGSVLSVSCAYTGSTHTVLFGDEPPGEDRFQAVSPLIERHPFFPERSSVLWCWPSTAPAHFGVRIWERGAGETWGCGTGACAVATLAIVKGLVPDGVETVTVESRGGTLAVSWPRRASLLMAGPAEAVFSGQAP